MTSTTLAPPAPSPAATRRRAPSIVAPALALTLLYLGVVVWPLGRWIDQGLLDLVERSVDDQVAAAADRLLSWESATTVALVLAVLLAVGAVRGRLRAAAASVAAVGLAAVATEVLKLGILSRPADVGSIRFALLPGTGSFPSGHVTIAAALALAAFRTSAPTWRPVVAVVAVSGAALVGVCVVVAGWHRPGDVLAGVLVALLAERATRRLGRFERAGDLRPS